MTTKPKPKLNGKRTAQKQPNKKNEKGVTPGRKGKFPSRSEIAAMLTTWGESADENEKLVKAVEVIMRGPLNTPGVAEAFLGVWESLAANGERLIDDHFASTFFGWSPGTAKRVAMLCKEGRWEEIKTEKLGLKLLNPKTAVDSTKALNHAALSRDALEKKLCEVSSIDCEQKKKVLDLLEVIVRTPLKPETIITEFHTLWHLRTEIDEKELDKIIKGVLGLQPGKARSLALAFEDRWVAQQGNAPHSAGGGQIQSESPSADENRKADAKKPEDDNQNWNGDRTAPSGQAAAGEKTNGKARGEDTANPASGLSSETPATVTYEDHHYAAIFPLDDGEPLDQLADDIRGNGLREPIVLFEAKILDGRRRYRACLRSGTPPVFVEFESSDPAAFVLSKNIHRRNLEKGQRAAIAAELLLVIEKEARERKDTTNGSTRDNEGRFSEKSEVEKIPPTDGTEEADAQPAASERQKSRDIAGTALDVNPHYVSDAKAMMENAPDLHEQLKQGKITMSQAKREWAKRNPEKQSTSKKESKVEWLPFTVILWDESGNDAPIPAILNDKKKRKSLASAVVFHLTPQPKFALGLEGKDGFRDAALFVIPVNAPAPEQDDGLVFQKPSCLFLVARTCGDVPKPEMVVGQLIEGGADEARKKIEKMWPSVPRLISNGNGTPPEGWQVG